MKKEPPLRRFARDVPFLLLLAALALVAGTYIWRSLPPDPSPDISGEMLVLTEIELKQLKSPTWRQLQEAYDLTPHQIVKSICLTNPDDSVCKVGGVPNLSAPAIPTDGALILYLSDR